MNITSAQYTSFDGVNNDGIEVLLSSGEFLSVPLDAANRHYAEIMRQVDAGELTIQEAD